MACRHALVNGSVCGRQIPCIRVCLERIVAAMLMNSGPMKNRNQQNDKREEMRALSVPYLTLSRGLLQSPRTNEIVRSHQRVWRE